MFVAEVLFCVFFFFTAYPYAVYPLILYTMKKSGSRQKPEAKASASVTVIIAAKNEAEAIIPKIQNTLEALLFYKEQTGAKVELIVASDGSTDETPSIAEEAGARVLHYPEGGGKELTQTRALKEAKGEILLFTDAKSMLDKDAILNASAYFQDENVGAVSSTDIVLNKAGEPAGEGFYVKFEMWLREMESSIYSLVGMSGSAFFVRRSLVESFAPNTCSDFASVLFCGYAGKVAKHGEDVICRYYSISDESKEYSRKVRTVLRGMNTFWHYKGLVFARHVNGLFRFFVLSHKPARWLSPVFFILALLFGFVAAFQSLLYFAMFFGLFSVLIMASLGHYQPELRQEKLVKIPYFFVLTNVAMLDALYKLARGQKTASWTPSDRP